MNREHPNDSERDNNTQSKGPVRYKLLRRVDKLGESEELDLILRHWFEELPIIIDFFRWFILSLTVGVIIGAGVRLFLWLLELSIHWTKSISPKYYYIMPLGFAISAFLVYTFAREAEGHGTEKVIEAVHKRSGKIPAKVVPVKALATIVTIATGGSAGKEGPSAQIGAAISSIFADLFKFNDHDRKKLVICGISAAFAAVFGTPVAGAIFGVEVLFLGNLLYDVIFPSFIAGMSSYFIAKNVFHAHYFFDNLNLSLPDLTIDHTLILKVIAISIVISFLAIIFIEILEIVEIWKNRIKISPVLKSLIGGMILVILADLVGTRYLGLGLRDIAGSFMGESFSLKDAIMKMIFTSVTLNLGSGGIITPIFYIGAVSGNALAQLFNINPTLGAILGLSAMVAASTNAPISATLLAIELFGGHVAPLAAIASIVSFVVVGYKSVYPTQVISIRKAYNVDVPVGVDVHTAEHTPLSSEYYIPLHTRRRFFRKLFEILWYIREPFRTLKCILVGKFASKGK